MDKINSKWVRLAALLIVATNSSFMIMGHKLLPFENDEIVSGISVVALVGSEIWNHWKNNSYTNEAKRADQYMNKLKGKL